MFFWAKLSLSRDGLKFLVRNEGLKQRVYLDSAGLPTIGVGHLLTRDELTSGKIIISGESVKYKSGISKKQAFDLLAKDVSLAESTINKLVKPKLKQNEFDALVSFVFNVGVRAFKNSTLLKKLNDNLKVAVPFELNRWVYSKGKVIQGLKDRRSREGVLWTEGIYG